MGVGVFRTLLRPASFTLGPDATLNTEIYIPKWAHIEDGDYNASITTHTERKNRKQCGNHKAKTSYKEKEQRQDHHLRTVSRINCRGGGGGGGRGGSQLHNFILGPDVTLNTEKHIPVELI